jgi:hypothetical protein
MSDDDFKRKTLSLAADPTGRRKTARARATRDFQQATQRAFLEDTLALVRRHRQPSNLLPFEQVREKLQLGQKSYLGIAEIPLAQIVGSVGRYTDFTRTFMPRKAEIRQRWEQVDRLAERGGWPPIEVYKVSDTYFVRDGNHRVSVARQLGMDTIEAKVWEYPTRVPLESDDDLDDILVRAEYLEFLEDTELDRLRPDQRIILTIPGGYWKLEDDIASYRYWQEWAEDCDLTWDETITGWYDNVYLPIVEKIRTEDVLGYFPGRTEADLVVWVLLHRDKLEIAQNFEDVMPDQAAEDFAKRTKSNPWRRLLGWLGRTL